MVVPIILYIDQRTDWRMLLILPLAVQAEIDATWLARCQIRGLSSQLIAEPSATVLPNKSVSLALNRVQTDTKPGKYAFDLLLQSPLGDRRKTVQGTAIIASTVTIWQVPPVTPPAVPPDATPPWLTDAVNSAIATHNANPSAHPGLITGGGGGIAPATIPSRQFSITQSDLATDGSFAIALEVGEGLSVWDDAGFYVEPSIEVIGFNTIEVELIDFTPLLGTWHIAIVTRFGSPRYEQLFTQSSIVSSSIMITHGLNKYPSRVDILSEAGQVIEADSIQYISANAIAVNLASVTPITGEWKAIIV